MVKAKARKHKSVIAPSKQHSATVCADLGYFLITAIQCWRKQQGRLAKTMVTEEIPPSLDLSFNW